MQPYDSKAVANYFLRLGEKDGLPITQLKLQKLVFLAHAWNLGIHHEPLIKDQISAWRHGPVVYELYNEFRDSGSEQIDHEAGPPGLRPQIPAYDTRTVELLDSVWDEHKKFSGVDLSAMTHKKGAPWHQILLAHNRRLPRNAVIPNEIIERYYSKLAVANPDVV